MPLLIFMLSVRDATLEITKDSHSDLLWKFCFNAFMLVFQSANITNIPKSFPVCILPPASLLVIIRSHPRPLLTRSTHSAKDFICTYCVKYELCDILKFPKCCVATFSRFISLNMTNASIEIKKHRVCPYCDIYPLKQ